MDAMLPSASVAEPFELRPRSIVVWTATGITAWAEAYRRIYERELLARLPDARIQFACPLADGQALASERGDIVTSLAAPADQERAAPDGVVVAGAEAADLAALADDLAVASRAIPYIFSALRTRSLVDAPGPVVRTLAAARDVSVRDAASLEEVRLAFGDSRPVALVPDPLILLNRFAPPLASRSRIAYLRVMEDYPLADTLLVEVSAARTGHLPPLALQVSQARARGYRLVVVALPMDGEPMTAELQQCIERTLAPVHCLDRLCFEDRVAVIATATAVVPLSASLLAAACAFGLPSLWCAEAASDHSTALTALPGADALIHDSVDTLLLASPDVAAPEAWRASIDAHFDRIAADLLSLALDAPGAPVTELDRCRQLERALRMTGRRVADERLRFAQRTEGLLADIVRLQRERARQSAAEAALREETAGTVAHARHLSAQRDLSRDRVAHLEAAEKALAGERATMSATIAALSNEHAALVRENGVQAGVIADLVRQRDELQGAVERFARSKSWRYLAPARIVGQFVRRLFGIPR